jgi:hypothetical protein
MPVRSLSSSVFRWPDAQAVDQAVRRWAKEQVRGRPDVLRIGYIGSYARGDWGVGSDLDLVVVVECCEQPFWRRALAWDVTSLPVPTDVLAYTQEEWQSLSARGERFYRTIKCEAVWVYVREAEQVLSAEARS